MNTNRISNIPFNTPDNVMIPALKKIYKKYDIKLIHIVDKTYIRLIRDAINSAIYDTQ